MSATQNNEEENQVDLNDGESMILEEEIDEDYEPTQEGKFTMVLFIIV